MTIEHFDVLVVGAGISGIDAGYHLQTYCPGRSYAILEGRDAIGGTWDLFRYPGIRSDSDMYTLGYSWKPWKSDQAVADGALILDYVREAAREHGIDRKIRFGHRVTRAEWSSEDSRWMVTAEHGALDAQGAQSIRFTCSFLFMCSGYYRYDAGYTPEFPGIDRYRGQLVHPQKWSSEVDYAGKRVIVIGSGATAVTLVPAMAEKAAHVTMLQRSPTYMVARPALDGSANFLRRILPIKLAYGITRWKHVMLGMFFFWLCRTYPNFARRMLMQGVANELPDRDITTDFKPKYNPWDQRVCLVRDGDLFAGLRERRIAVVTDHIETFTETGVALKSGQTLEADVIITATGLELIAWGGMEAVIDGQRFDPGGSLAYKGMMFRDVPNLASSFGYTNASWTLKCDLTCRYVCRLLNHMQEHGYTQCTPRKTDPSVQEAPWLDFSSGYVTRSLHRFPKQGDKRPWRLYQNYALDLWTLKLGAVDDGVLEFRGPLRETESVAIESAG